jgi:YD repeat-containing protein
MGTGGALSTSVFMAYGPSGGLNLIFPGHHRFELAYNWSDSAYEDSRDPEMLGAKFTQGAGQTGLAGTLALRNGDAWQFDNQGNCWQEQDRHGNFVNIDGGTFSQAVRYGGSYYPRADFAYTAGHVTAITYTYTTSNPPARAWSLAYDGNNRLSTITDPQGNAWHYTWTTYTRSDGQVLPLLSTITTPRGNVIFSALYDTSGRITQYTAADTGVTHFSYSAALGADGTTTVTNPLSHAASWSYTWPTPPAGETAKFGYRLTSTTDPLGRQTQFAATHAGSNLITQITDYRNRVTTQNWDFGMGNLLSVTKPTASGSTATTSYTYASAFNQVSSVTDPLLRQTTATIDASTGNTTQTNDARNNPTYFGYDSVTGDTLSSTNALGQSRYMTYDYYGDLTRITDGTNTLYSAVYDSAARKTSETDANGKTTTYVYDSLDRLTSVTRTLSGQAVTTSFQYDADSNRTQLTDPNTHTWTWAFDAMDRVSQETNPLAQSVTVAYDLAGNVQTRTDRLGQQAVLTYDAANRPLIATFKRADGSTQSTVTLAYDPTTKLLASVTDTGIGSSNNVTSWLYDNVDRPVTETRPGGTQLHFVLDDKTDRRLTLQFPNLSPNPGDIGYSFDNNDNVTGITRNGLTTGITYDALNRRSVQTLPSGVTTNWAYDAHGFVSLILSHNGNLDGHGYTRDAVGNITQENVNGGTFTYGYDDLCRLTSASVMGTSYAWIYDKAGNRTQQIAGGVTTNYTYNAADRMLTVNSTAVSHDANGQVTADETGGAYTWDVQGRLSSLTRNGVSASFVYDQEDLRLSKTVGSVTTSYLLDGDEVVRETTAGSPTDLLQGPGTDNLLSRGGNWLLHNGLASTSAVVNGSGTLQQFYYYAPFGQAVVQGGGAVQPYQFTGREVDETGLRSGTALWPSLTLIQGRRGSGRRWREAAPGDRCPRVSPGGGRSRRRGNAPGRHPGRSR